MNSLYDESPFLEHHGIKGQNMLQQQNITMEQFMQSPQQYVQQIVPQDRLQWAMQQANAIYGRK